ncbi:MAG: hypothetical protein B7X48_08830 [Acidiphilium sp. 34-60-192]|nr:MAG: hypothetical protein B7X48_08830 [Acidiphilium sp. 34-60-192]
MAGTLSQAAACRRYGIAKGSMSRHMANHADQPAAARSDALDVLDHAEARTAYYQADPSPDPAQGTANGNPPPLTIERSETTQASLRTGLEQADPALNAEQTHAKPIEAAPMPPTYPYPAASIMKHSLPIGARCRQCGGASWWQRRFDGYTACMTCYRPGGYSLLPGVAIIAT